MSDAMRDRAADQLDREFEREYRELMHMHRGAEQRDLAFHKSQLHGFARNREVAELRYAARMRQQQNGIGGRLARLTRAGREKQAAQWERLDERAAQLQGRATRQFNALTERQFQAEQKERIWQARTIKLHRDQNAQERQQHRQDHLATRDRRVEERGQALKREEAERALRQGLRQHDRLQGRALTR